MGLDFDKEMDSLLRNLPGPARGAAADASTDPARRERKENARAATAHLDADELSAYAENALPAAATRARYVAHLADCETCRRLATNIAMAADVAGALERSDSTEPATVKAAAVPSGWRAWLVSFFSPRVLLYAAPALAVLVAGTALFIMMQTRQRSASQIARVVPTAQIQREDATSGGQVGELNKAQEQPRAAAVSEPAPRAVSQGAPPAAVAPAPSARQAGEPEKAETFADAAKNEAAAPSSAPAAPTVSEGVSLSSTETKQAQKTADDDALRVERGTAATPSTTTPPVKEIATAPPKEEAREKRVEEVAVTGVSKVADAPSKRADQPDSRDARPADAERQNRRAEGLTTVSPAAPKTELKSAPSAKARRGVPPARNDSVSESSGDTRSVAGRQFRREGGAWVDTAYKASTSLTNVTRGSEQYRALVADEPELRRVAEQLGGEVIVLWKNRAYRIR